MMSPYHTNLLPAGRVKVDIGMTSPCTTTSSRGNLDQRVRGHAEPAGEVLGMIATAAISALYETRSSNT